MDNSSEQSLLARYKAGFKGGSTLFSNVGMPPALKFEKATQSAEYSKSIGGASFSGKTWSERRK